MTTLYRDNAIRIDEYYDIYKANDDAICIGSFHLHRRFHHRKTHNECMFNFFVIDVSYRRRGYGTAVVRGAIDIARQQGYSEFSLIVRRDNIAALKVYRKFNMIEANYIGNPDYWLDMRLKL